MTKLKKKEIKEKSNIRLLLLVLMLMNKTIVLGQQKPNEDIFIYNSNNILALFSKTLNRELLSYPKDNRIKAKIKDSKPLNFFIFDLTDTTNINNKTRNIKFLNGHVYHFAFMDYYFGFSNICILENGKIKIFEKVNCEKKTNSLQLALRYLDEFLIENPNKTIIINRVKNYKNYSAFWREDNFSYPKCN